MADDLEVWLRGPLPGVPALLQPVAHALLQAREEAHAALDDFDAAHLWARPAGVASVGFHLKHLRGVLDRMATYARAEALTPLQLSALADEATHQGQLSALLRAFDSQVDAFVTQLRATAPGTLPQNRTVGRRRLPSTHIGLLVHAAEHTTRHVGQLIVTAAVAPRTPPPA